MIFTIYAVDFGTPQISQIWLVGNFDNFHHICHKIHKYKESWAELCFQYMNAFLTLESLYYWFDINFDRKCVTNRAR